MSNEWGQLKGVRPVKLVHYLNQKYQSEEEVTRTLRDKHKLPDKTINLLMNVARVEREAISPLLENKNNVALYVNIPFCPSRCTYCSFITIGNKNSKDLQDRYLIALLKELRAILDFLKASNKNISLIYIGGGTPTVFDSQCLEQILSLIKSYGNNKVVEFTVEAGRADTVSSEKFDIFKKYGVNRVSINPQTMNEDTLKKVNRNHSIEQVYKATELASKNNFIVNMDMILGLPDEDVREVQHTLNEILSLNPHNITVHNLAKKRTSYLNQKNCFTNSDKVVLSEMNHISRVQLKQNEYYPYYLYRQKNTTGGFPNVGYTKSGYVCLYNIAMISEVCSIYGCGAGSITKVLDSDSRFERFSTPKDAVTYIKKIDEIIDKKIRWFKDEERK